QGPCFQDGPEFDFQEFRHTVDVSTLMPPPLDCTDYDFSLGEDVAFGPCTPPLQSSSLVEVPPQNLSSPEPCWRDLADQHQKALGDALEANSQLQETLTQRQEELVTLQKSNVQLKELASQARQLAAVLDVSAARHPSWLPHGDSQEQGLRCGRGPCGVGWSSGAQCGAKQDGAVRCRSRDSHSLSPARTGRAAPRPGGRELEGGGSLRAALGEAGAIRTLAFPQGNAFTLRTAAGGHRFRWVPR
ncbi:MCIN protein, partial [Hypocryptadius cinnamomeus]|nr:MCIN protein [Hypocryptadius cinnamomeus]